MPRGIYAHITGANPIRNECGDDCVLEDDTRFSSDVSAIVESLSDAMALRVLKRSHGVSNGVFSG
ncbi:MAG: hypothetical protein KatS3mg052_0539 [Candidatus Roseilinea sp.]|nr:MAG: hypothetical protein KatS3mg052_0539 [Candidatus Roseilinea sp.]